MDAKRDLTPIADSFAHRPHHLTECRPHEFLPLVEKLDALLGPTNPQQETGTLA
ncbi:hypothetical protein [Paraburkholderia sp. RL17-347-BIC-D]|uniref:hypothetical protein n=1 Tax=Paraburkholderia sp. RL17-347-BIC-D TaxID=3031632 RepID=UPI0038BD75CC